MFPKFTVVLALLSPMFAADTPSHAAGLTVHEWGTFTSVASQSGSPMYWVPLAAPSDLPCFVNRLSVQCIKCGAATVRMETPVIYFYSPQPATVSVHVDLPSGLITEWYPRAVKVSPTGQTYGEGGKIDWGKVEIGSTGAGEFPDDGSPSHYYAARATDSAALRVNGEQEKLLFYRGVAREGVFLEPRQLGAGRMELRRAGIHPIPVAILFENRDGKTGYRVVHDLEAPVTLDPPELTAGVTAVQRELAAALTAAGLYQKEAAAMIETWRDSWFEEGMRLFYLIPRPEIDNMLPLKVAPSPVTTTRVFVGRVEVLSPYRRHTIETALAQSDTTTLSKCARFLDPFLSMIKPANLSPGMRSFINQARIQAAKAGNEPCKTAPFSVPTDDQLQ